MKLSDLTPEQWYLRLNVKRMTQSPLHRGWWDYYDGVQPLYFIAKVLVEQDNRFPPLTINWCQKFVDWIDARTQVDGFRIGEDATDDELWQIWKRNNLDVEQSENNVASLVTGYSYAMATPDDDGRALLTIETPDSCAVQLDPRTRREIAGLKVWKSDPDSAVLPDMAELHLPGVIYTIEDGEFVSEKKQKSDTLGVVAFLNRRRYLRGHSELGALKPLVDAANQTATNMMAAIEHHAVPRKWAIGVDEESFLGEDGKPIPAWQIATGAVWLAPYDAKNPNANVSIGQFSATDLRNFHDTLTLIARIGAGLCDMAPHEFGMGVADNPASADGIEAAKESGVRRVERILASRAGGYERLMKIAASIEGRDPATLDGLTTVWRDPSTPTHQAKVAAAAQSFTTGLADLRQAREDAGYSGPQIEAMERREKASNPFALLDPVTQAAVKAAAGGNTDPTAGA